MPQNKYSEARQRYVIDQSDEMINKVKSLQRIFYSILLDEYLSNLHTKNGIIQPTIRNYSLTEKANKRIPALYADTGGTDFLHGLAKVIKKILRLNVDYFADAVGNRSKIKALSDPILNKVQRQMGYNYDEKTIVPGGFLSTLIVLESPLAKIKRLTIQSIRSSAQIAELLDALRVLVNGETKDQRGIIEKEISDVTQDLLPRMDRNISTDFATDLQFSYAIYQGGLIKTSRPFCIARNDKVFHHDEIEKFGTNIDQYGGYSNKPDFAGKTDPYDPFRDLGGHNCRHSLDWISDELAEQLLKV